MIIMENVLNSLSTVVAALIGSYVTVLIFRNERYSEVARERLDNVYAPAFRLIEPYLYKKISRHKFNALVTELEEIALSGGILTDPEFLARLTFCKKTPERNIADNLKKYEYRFFGESSCYLDYWFDLCHHIDQTYDALCHKAFLPVRSISYRLDRGQYIHRLIWWFYCFKFLLPQWLIFVLMLLWAISLAAIK